MYFIDVQGTLIDDLRREPIEGSIEFIDLLNAQKTPYIVITNNTKHSSKEFLAYLNSIGLHIRAENYIDPLMVVEMCVSKESVAAYGTSEFLNILKDMGYSLNYENPKEVLISIKKDFNNEEFAQMIDFLLSGAKLSGMHETTIYAKDSKRYPGVGAILKLLEFATSVPYSVVGKPSDNFYLSALKLLKKQTSDAEFRDITIISDDVKGDLVGAKKLGMKCVFVLSGKYKNADEILPNLKEFDQPHETYKNISEFMINGVKMTPLAKGEAQVTECNLDVFKLHEIY